MRNDEFGIGETERRKLLVHVCKCLGTLVPHSHPTFPASPNVFVDPYRASESQFTMTSSSRKYALDFLSFVNASPTREPRP